MKKHNKVTNIKKGVGSKMKIALFTDTFEDGYGGVTVYVRNLANYLKEEGHFVKIFVWESQNLTKEDREICVTFPNINVVKSVRGKAGFSTRKILKKISEFSPDLIHNHSQYSMGLQAIIVSKKMKIPIINHYHMYLEGGLNHFPSIFQKTPELTNAIIKKESKIFFTQCDLAITPTKIMGNHLKEIGVKNKIVNIPFGIDLNKFKKEEKYRPKKFTLLYVGRLNKEKNIEDLIRIFTKFAKDKDVILKIIGDGAEKEKLEILSKTLKIKEKIQFLGWVKREELSKEYNSANMFITLSEMETFGIVILEAMACGLPIIGANALAIPELVTNNKNGFLVNKTDEQSILDKLELIYKNKNIEAEFSLNSILIAKSFEEKKVFKNLEKVYNNLIQ